MDFWRVLFYFVSVLFCFGFSVDSVLTLQFWVLSVLLRFGFVCLAFATFCCASKIRQ